MGRAEMRVDNQRAGGLVCGIRNGVLSGVAFDGGFTSVTTHPDSGVPFLGTLVPGYHVAVESVLRSHSRTPWADLASWDIAIDPDGNPVYIEVNTKGQGINLHQLCNGPLFETVIDEIKSRMGMRRTRSALLGFV